MKQLVLLVGLLAWLVTGLLAQSPTPNPQPRGKSPWYVHYGKWAAAAGAVALTVLGAQEHNKSNDVYGNLLDLCHADDKNCALNPNGTYIDPGAEEMYQSSLSYDRRARARLIAGQVSLLLCAGLFVADLRHKGPENIPVHIDPLAGRVGVRVRF
ncbi:MAG TPA: hypothetical protein VLV16_11845 [Gemmatimonadales bacterium]|nr:hypothetical protein [Gemmatimonadales bacterium]